MSIAVLRKHLYNWLLLNYLRDSTAFSMDIRMFIVTMLCMGNGIDYNTYLCYNMGNINAEIKAKGALAHP